MKPNKNIRDRTNKEILNKLNEIQKSLIFSGVFACAILVISITFAVLSLAVALQSMNLFWIGYFLLLVFAGFVGALIGLVIIFKKWK